jgi:hypothetical protein
MTRLPSCHKNCGAEKQQVNARPNADDTVSISSFARAGEATDCSRCWLTGSQAIGVGIEWHRQGHYFGAGAGRSGC